MASLARKHLYSLLFARAIPKADRPQRRRVEVQVLAREIRILETGRLITVHPLLAGRGRRSLLQGHRRPPEGTSLVGNDDRLLRPGLLVQQRP